MPQAEFDDPSGEFDLYGLVNTLRFVAAGSFGHLEFPERLVKMELAVPIDCMRLPRSGRYEIAILFDGRELATQFIDIEAENDDEAR